MDELTLYTTHCPKCSVLEKKLIAKGLSFTTCDNIAEMQKLNIDTVPVLAVNDKLLSFQDAVNYINNVR